MKHKTYNIYNSLLDYIHQYTDSLAKQHNVHKGYAAKHKMQNKS